MEVIEFKNVSESYKTKFVFGKKCEWREIWALCNGSFNVRKGETVGIIGENGAGKTTLLKLIAGMIKPDRGEIKTQGRILTLMEIGAGFHSDLTGRENIYFNASLYGIDRKVMDKRIGEIIDFAEIGKFIDAPIKYYSQGMYLRLAFALAIHVDPDILLIDDILTVGDEDAQRKCINKIFELKEKGKTIIFVSHAMNMVYKLCDRVIFLKEGRIIQIEEPRKVISRYLETVGKEKGIAELNRGDLRIVFNNGGLFISWKNFPLTKHYGGYTALHVPVTQNWSFSVEADWEIIKKTESEILAKGFSEMPGLTQIWKIQIKNDCQFGWDINMECKDSSIKEKQIGFFLTPEYKEWISLDKKEKFPPFSFRSDWQEMDLGNYKSDILALGGAGSHLPILALKVKNNSCFLRAFNTGYDKECRLIQRRLLKENQFSGEINIYPNKDKFEDYFQKIRKQYQKVKEEEQKRQLSLRTISREKEQKHQLSLRTISRGDLRVYADVEKKVLRVYYQEKEITKGSGLYSLIEVREFGKLSFDSSPWEIEKKSSEKLNIISSNQVSGVTQIWTLTCKKDNILDITIDLEVRKNPLFLTNQAAILAVAGNYTEWKTPYEEGSFYIRQYIGDIGPVKLKHNKTSKIFLRGNEDKAVPKLTFDCSSSGNSRILSIDRRKNMEFILIRFSKLISRKSRKVPIGKHNFFNGQIIFNQEILLEDDTYNVVHKLSRGKLKLVFDEGKGRIFWKDKELTSGLGMYTSIRSSGIWHDSTQAIWQVEKIENDKMLLIGEWSHIPISQLWQLKIISETLIYWKVEMEIYNPANLEIEQSNAMLSKEYKEWIVPNVRKGEFLDEFTNQYDISPFRFWYGKINENGLVVTKSELPNFSVRLKDRDDSYRTIIENTDSLYKARLLQYQRVNTDELPPKKYKYFEGLIQIEI